MTKFNYKKWVTELKYGKQPHLFEQDDKEKKDKKDDKKADKKDKPSKPKKDDKPSKPKKDDKPSEPKSDDKPSEPKSDDKGSKGPTGPDVPGREWLGDEFLLKKGVKREISTTEDLMEQINPNLRDISFRWVTTICASTYHNPYTGDQGNCHLCHGNWSNLNLGCPSFHVDGIPCCNGVGGGSGTYGATNTSMISVDGQVPQVGQLIQWDDTAVMGSIVEITAVHPPYTANNNPHNYPSVSCPTQVYDAASCPGATGATCMEIQAQVCGGSQTVTWPCSTINGQLPTASDVGTTVQANQGDWEITAVNPSTSSPFGTQDFQPGNPCPGTGTTGCDDTDFDVTASCGSQHLMNSPLGNIGGANSWTTWLTAQMNAFNGNAGCNQFGAIQNWTLAQITPTANCPALPALSQFGQYGGENNQGNCHPEIGVKRKFAKSKWAYCMSQLCAGGSQAGC